MCSILIGTILLNNTLMCQKCFLEVQENHLPEKLPKIEFSQFRGINAISDSTSTASGIQWLWP